MAGSAELLPPDQSLVQAEEEKNQFFRQMLDGYLDKYNKAVLCNQRKLGDFYEALLELSKQDAYKQLEEAQYLLQMFVYLIDLYELKTNPSTKADEKTMVLFTQYMVKLNEAIKNPTENKTLMQVSQDLLTETLKNVESQTTQAKKPMHPALSAIVGGIIGAVVGGIMFAAVAAACSWYVGGVAAIPAFFVGLVKGFMVGSTSSILASGFVGGASVLLAGVFGSRNYADRRDVDKANAQRTLSGAIKKTIDDLDIVASGKTKANLVASLRS